jgi:hypothetical protein
VARDSKIHGFEKSFALQVAQACLLVLTKEGPQAGFSPSAVALSQRENDVAACLTFSRL